MLKNVTNKHQDPTKLSTANRAAVAEYDENVRKSNTALIRIMVYELLSWKKGICDTYLYIPG